MRRRDSTLLVILAIGAGVAVRVLIFSDRLADEPGDAAPLASREEAAPEPAADVRLSGAPKPPRDVAQAPATRKGRVEWEDGTPVVGAEVLGLDGAGGATEWRFTTGPDGVFEAPGSGVAVRVGGTVQQRLFAGTGPLEFRFARPGAIEGIVVDRATDRPLAEFTLRLVTEPEDSVTKFVRAGLDRTAPSGAVASRDGTFRLEGVPAGRVRVFARASGHREGTTEDAVPLSVRPGETTGGVKIALAAAYRVTGHVVDPSGTGIGGATVSAYEVVDGREAPAFPRGGVLTAPDGAFELPAVGPGRLEIGAVATGAFATATFEVGNADVSGIRIVLAPAGNITGRVVDAEGRPVPRARVEAFHPDGVRREGVADRTGEFWIDQVRPGPVVVRWRSYQRRAPVVAFQAARTDDARAALWGALREAGTEVEVRPGGDVTVLIQLPRRVRLRGLYLVDGVGPGVAGELNLVAEGDDEDFQVRHDADGAFTTWIEPGSWTVEALDAKEEPQKTPLVVPEDVQELVVRIDR